MGLNLNASKVAANPASHLRLTTVSPIPGLVWEETPLDFVPKNPTGSSGIATFKGHGSDLSGASLIVNFNSTLGSKGSQPGKSKLFIISKENGEVLLHVPVVDAKNTVYIKIIDSFGKVSSGELTISSSQDEKPKLFRAELSIGPSILTYREQSGTLTISISEIALKTDGSVYYAFKPDWEIGGNAYLAAPLFRTNSQPLELKASQFYGLSGWLEHPIKEFSSGHRLLVRGGYYYWGMILADNYPDLTYGVNSLNGPQASLQYEFYSYSFQKRSVGVKYALIKNGWTVTPSNYAIALWGDFAIGLLSSQSNHLVSIGCSVARTAFSEPFQTFGLTAIDLSLSLSL